MMRVPVPLILSVLLAACASSDDAGPSHEASCEMACARVYECDSSVDEQTCAANCKNDTADVGPHLSQAFLAGIDMCVDQLNCAQLALAGYFQTCQNEASARIAPSAAAEDLCQAVVETVQECTGLTIGTAGCLDGVKIFNDASLRAGRRCDERPCDQRAACLQAELGIDPTATQ